MMFAASSLYIVDDRKIREHGAAHGMRIGTRNRITLKNGLIATLSTIIPTLPDPGTNPGHLNGKPAVLRNTSTEICVR
jgi:hypothetical protein